MDFHGMNLDDSINAVHLLVGRIRSGGKSEQVTLITGHGIIRDSLIEVLSNYGLSPSLEPGNAGAIKVLIE